ncbi:LysR family transcriptional regulator [Paraburkholderia tropica]|uniref:LysR family transcriptional regulator n=1 Tax=Paraburkholderia tropica TaxID=92647 RepID=UPI002AB29831|nr:LysR family transcriptional regulator [Paraburkholderia tropica]
MKDKHTAHQHSAAMSVCAPASNKDVVPLVLGDSDLRLLRIFRAVAEAGGLAAAERALDMDRSTISRQLTALETRLDARLCFRGPGGFELTDFGRAALRAAIDADDTLQTISHDLNRARSVLSGDLHIGIADNCLTNPGCRLVESLRHFRQLAPDVTVHLSIHLPSELLARLADRHLHIAITGATPGISGTSVGNTRLICRPLFGETFRLYVAAHATLPPPTIDELRTRGYELVVRERDPHTTQLGARLGISRHGVSVGLEAVATLLASGRFVGYLPTHYVDALQRNFAYVAVADADDLSYTTHFSLFVAEDRQVAPVGRLFVQVLEDVHRATERPRLGAWPIAVRA